jgi:beta-fructofuranosidase
MQYWKPEGAFFVGDCIPFWHDGLYHLFYLLDENHHQGLGGMGGHQWAHATTSDLVHWRHHPLALAIDEDFERSICTGTPFFHDGRTYAFYATRLPDWRQVLGRAVSDDGFHFTKLQPNPFAVPPHGYNPLHFRDPIVFADAHGDGFHMLVTSVRDDWPLVGRGGCLAHLHSPDLQDWQMREPFLVPGFDDAPECPDYFAWNGWYYLLFSNHLTTRYRMSRMPLGPWLRPAVDVLDSPWARVMKTAPFGAHRRIGAAWLGTRAGDRDDGKLQWGGNLVLREIVQHPDGTLGTKFAPEVALPAGAPLALQVRPLTLGAGCQGRTIHLRGASGLEAAVADNIPLNVRIRMKVQLQPGAAKFGLRLRGDDFAGGCELAFLVPERMVTLHDTTIYGVEGLAQPFSLEIVAYEDVFDVCIDERRCIINRCPQPRGDKLFLFAQNAEVTLHNLQVEPLLR